MMGSLVYLRLGLEKSPYGHLLDGSHWVEICETFTRDACSLLGLSVESPLSVRYGCTQNNLMGVTCFYRWKTGPCLSCPQDPPCQATALRRPLSSPPLPHHIPLGMLKCLWHMNLGLVRSPLKAVEVGVPAMLISQTRQGGSLTR